MVTVERNDARSRDAGNGLRLRRTGPNARAYLFSAAATVHGGGWGPTEPVLRSWLCCFVLLCRGCLLSVVPPAGVRFQRVGTRGFALRAHNFPPYPSIRQHEKNADGGNILVVYDTHHHNVMMSAQLT